MILVEQIETMVSEKLGVDKRMVNSHVFFYEDLGADSLDVLELLSSIEKELGVAIPDEEVEKIKTVGALTTYVATHQVSAPH